MVSSEVIHDFTAGCIGGLAGLVVGHPFDTTKVQLQTKQTTNSYKHTWDAVQNIHSQGLRNGFFRGMAVPLASYGLVNAVFFGVYGNTLKFLKRDELQRQSNYLEIFLAGSVGGMVQMIPACPIEVVKTVLQSQIPHGMDKTVHYSGVKECLGAIYRQSGLAGYYRGLPVMSSYYIPFFGVYTLTYEYVYTELKRTRWCDRHGIMASIIAGGCAGLSSWIPCLPLDFVKNRMQADVNIKQYRHVLDCVSKSYQEGGIRIFFRGLIVTSIRAWPVNAATFLVYSQTLKYLENGK